MRSGLITGLCLLSLGCGTETVVHEQTERDANQILVTLESRGIEATKVRSEKSRKSAFDVVVASSDKSTAYRVLADNGLPRTRPPGSLETLPRGLVPTTEGDRARREAGARGDIVNALLDLPGVTHATALVSFPESKPLAELNEIVPKPKVSIVVHAAVGDAIPTYDHQSLARLVAARMPEVSPQQVGVQLRTKVLEREPAQALCPRASFAGISICRGARTRLANTMLVGFATTGMITALMLMAAYRAIKYRRQLTLLSERVEHLRHP